MATAHSDSASPPTSIEVALPERTVFYDGVCNFCDHTVKWLLAHDSQERLQFAALQGATAEALRAALPDFPNEVDTIVYVDAAGNEPRVLLNSPAIFEILDQLDPGVRRFRVLRFLPRWLTDLAYRGVVRSRYRIFGRAESCLLPSPDLRARFLP